VGPRDDVDLFALQLAHHGLNAAAAHADAGADRVDRVVIADHGDLGARAGVTGHGLDLDDAVIDFRHFHLEQFGHELRVGARQEYLRTAGLAAHVLDIGADAVVRAIAFAADLFVAAQDRFATADIDDDVAVFLAFDDTVDDGADAVLELLVLSVTLGLTDLLQDHLLGRLRGDAAQLDRRNAFLEHIAGLRPA